MLNGVDISNLNGSVNVNLIKNAGHNFVIAKATEGTNFSDRFYNQNVANAKSLGLATGAYHFARFQNRSKAIQEANFFKSTACGGKPDFVVLDFEQLCSGDMTEACLAFLEIASSIAPAIIYCNPSYIKAYLNNAMTKYPLWIAHYGVAAPNTPLWGGYALWQYSEKGQIPGVSGYVDLNFMSDDFYKSLDTKIKPVYPIIAKLTDSIKALQYDLNVDYNAKITVNGIVDQETLDALQSISEIIVKGHKSKVVQWVQQKLIGYGYLKEDQATSIYDEATFQAVTNLQKNWNRETSGVISIPNRTWEIFLTN